jgi:hypothetical protein
MSLARGSSTVIVTAGIAAVAGSEAGGGRAGPLPSPARTRREILPQAIMPSSRAGRPGGSPRPSRRRAQPWHRGAPEQDRAAVQDGATARAAALWPRAGQAFPVVGRRLALGGPAAALLSDPGGRLAPCSSFHHRNGPTAARMSYHRRGGRGIPVVVHRDGRTEAGQQPGGRCADAMAGAGDLGDPPGERLSILTGQRLDPHLTHGTHARGGWYRSAADVCRGIRPSQARQNRAIA